MVVFTFKVYKTYNYRSYDLKTELRAKPYAPHEQKQKVFTDKKEKHYFKLIRNFVCRVRKK